MMDLSQEQMMAAIDAAPFQWSILERPVGPQPLPEWVRGAKVNWHEGFANAPSVRLKVIGQVRDWPDKRFNKEGKFYRARHPDGRMEQYAHDGAISVQPIRMFRTEDGELHPWRPSGPQWYVPEPNVTRYPPHGYAPGNFVDVDLPATTKQNGFGGTNIFLDMEDGTKLVLRGPWHTSPPAGYVEVSYRIQGDKWGGRAGLFITEDLYLRIMARFQAHLPIARVDHRVYQSIQPFEEEWGEPKTVRQEREYQAREAKRQAERAANRKGPS